MAFSLRLFGAVALERDGQPLSGPPVQRHRLALLALLATAFPRAVPRDKAMAWLWPERDDEHARGLLNQAIHVLRRTLGVDAIRSIGEELQLDGHALSCDVIAFEQALAAGDFEQAVAAYRAPFLDGFFLRDAPDFERWVDGERDRLAAACAGALESLAEQAEAAGDARRAVEWWKARTAHDPLDSRIAVRLMLALDASGNRAAALTHAGGHERRLMEELGIAPSAELRALVERLRSAPPGPAPASSAAHPPTAPPAPHHSAGPARGVSPDRPNGRRWMVMAAAGGVALAVLGLWAWRGDPVPVSGAMPAATVDEIAQAVAREMARRERGDTAAQPRQRRTRSLAAYELYLRGSDPVLLRSDSTALLALDYFQRAVALDSAYAAAWAGLARMSMRTSQLDLRAASGGRIPDAEAAALHAVALDDSLAEAQAVLGLVRIGQFDLAAAEAHLRRAVALDPASASHHEWLIRLFLWRGEYPQALVEARQALALAPMSPSATAELARALLANGRCDEALTELDRIADLDPPLLRAPEIRAQGLACLGRWEDALAAVQPRPELGRANGLQAWLLARSGQRDAAARVLEQLERDARSGEGDSWPVALARLGLGDVDGAMPWLRRAVDDESLSPFSQPQPLTTALLDSLSRQDRRIAELRRRLGLGAP